MTGIFGQSKVDLGPDGIVRPNPWLDWMGLVDAGAASRLDRRNRMSISINERQLYLDLNGHASSTTIEEHRLA